MGATRAGGHAAGTVQFRLLGPFEVLDRAGAVVDLGRPKERALLAVLALEVGRVVSADALVDQLWPDGPPGSPSSSIQAYVSTLRRALEPHRNGSPSLLVTRKPGYVLAVDPAQVDGVEFERRVAEGRQLVAAGDAAAGADALADALTLWRGDPLSDLAWLPAAVAATTHLAEVRLAAVESRIDAELALGRHAGAVAELEALVHEHPLRERLSAQLITALYRCGRQADALRAYDRLRETLVDQLGIDPSPSLQSLHAAVLAQDPSLAAPTAGAPAARPPAPGPVPASTAALALPPALRPARNVSIVGRTADLARLDVLWERAAAGTRSCAAIVGDAGIGKTRLASELARQVAAGGGTVLAGRCYEENVVPYQPVVEALRAHQAAVGVGAIAAHAGAGAAELAHLLPALGPPADHTGGVAADVDRYLLFEAVAGLLASMAADAPVLLVLDDLQWADASTVLLVRHLLHHPDPVRLLVVVTHRPLDASEQPAVADLMGGLRRDGVVTRVELGGLAEADVADLIKAHAGEEPPPGFAASIHAETEGNPFFIEEVLLHLLDDDRRAVSGDPFDGAVASARLGIPDGVADLIGRRLRRLPPAAVATLEAASVAGREFAVDVLAPVTGASLDELVNHLDAARRARLVTDGATAGTCSFAHPLVREAMYTSLAGLRRAQLHHRIATVLDDRASTPGAGPAADAATIAHHAYEGAVAGGAELAVRWCHRSGLDALAHVAYDEASSQLDRAATAAETAGAGPGDRAVILLDAAEAVQRGGDQAGARTRAGAAVDLARAAGRADLLARGALLFAGVATAGAAEPDVVALLSEALAALPAEPSAGRALLEARLAMEETFTDHAEADRRSLAAVTMSRAVGDEATLASVLGTRHWVLGGPDAVSEQLALAEEMIVIGGRLGHAETEFSGRHYLLLDLLALGRAVEAEAEAATVRELAERMRQPRHLWQVAVYRPLFSLLHGRLGDAEVEAALALELGQVAQPDNALVAYGVLLFILRYEQGRLAELEPAVRDFVSSYPAITAWRCALAYVCCEMGELDEARRTVDAVTGAGLDQVPRDTTWLVAMTFLARAAATLGDQPLIAQLRDLLAPAAGQVVVVAAGFACAGPVDLTLGVLAAAAGDAGAAVASFEQALALAEAADAPPWAVRAMAGLAGALEARDGAAAADRAADLRATAAATAARLGMGELVVQEVR